jgi:hypothetical protein
MTGGARGRVWTTCHLPPLRRGTTPSGQLTGVMPLRWLRLAPVRLSGGHHTSGNIGSRAHTSRPDARISVGL